MKKIFSFIILLLATAHIQGMEDTDAAQIKKAKALEFFLVQQAQCRVNMTSRIFYEGLSKNDGYFCDKERKGITCLQALGIVKAPIYPIGKGDSYEYIPFLETCQKQACSVAKDITYRQAQDILTQAIEKCKKDAE